MTEEQARKIKINDTVICNTSFKNLPQKGWEGKIIDKSKLGICLGIQWEKEFLEGHDCGQKGIDNRCRYYGITETKDRLNDSILILDLYKKQLEFNF